MWCQNLNWVKDSAHSLPGELEVTLTLAFIYSNTPKGYCGNALVSVPFAVALVQHQTLTDTETKRRKSLSVRGSAFVATQSALKWTLLSLERLAATNGASLTRPAVYKHHI